MSLATRCTSCGTVFRVVQDQLKVSEGWVRCGRCNEVFNALEGLFDLERDPLPEWPTVAAEAIDPDDLAEVRAADHFDPDLVERIDAQLFGKREAGDAAPPEPASHGDPVAALGPSARPDVAAAAVAAQRAPTARDEPANAPEFIRDAERQARWRRSPARWALGVASVLLALLLGLQVLHHFRDLSAARWPGLRPALAAWCGMAACTLEAPRRIDDVSVENSSLTRAAGPDAFRLAVTLRNRGPLTLALPSIDLSLTDTTGQLVARRALAPADFRSPTSLLAPGSEAALQLVLSAGSPKVTGYTVEIFYP